MVANLLRGMCHPDNGIAHRDDSHWTIYSGTPSCGIYTHGIKGANSQIIAVNNLNSMADNAVLQATIVRLKTQLSSAHNDLNELYDGEYTPRDMEIELRENDRLRKAHDEVEILQNQKNNMEEELYKSQDAKERLENILSKADIEFVKLKTAK